jgi:hypothetical protein
MSVERVGAHGTPERAMAYENLGLVRRAFQALNDRDFATFLSLYTEDCAVRNIGSAVGLVGGEFRGRDALSWLREMIDAIGAERRSRRSARYAIKSWRSARFEGPVRAAEGFGGSESIAVDHRSGGSVMVVLRKSCLALALGMALLSSSMIPTGTAGAAVGGTVTIIERFKDPRGVWPSHPGTTAIVRYGPFTVPAATATEPGMLSKQVVQNLPAPCSNCYITDIVPSLVYEDGTNASMESGTMLHHYVLFNQAAQDVTCPSGIGALGQRFFASGMERPEAHLPSGYGYLNTGGNWTLETDLMNMMSTPQQVYLQTVVRYEPASAGLSSVTPIWLDVNNCSTTSEYSIPTGYSDTDWSWTSTLSGHIVGIGGHQHDLSAMEMQCMNAEACPNHGSGIAISAELVGGPKSVYYGPEAHSEPPADLSGSTICRSQDTYFTPFGMENGYMGHLDTMSQCGLYNPAEVSGNAAYPAGGAYTGLGFPIESGQTIRLHSQYQNPGAPRSDVMGIMIPYVASAAAPPTAETKRPTPIAQKEATLRGTVNPDGTEVSECKFEYGTSTSYGQSAPCSSAPGSGLSPAAVSAAITGLTNKTTYHFRITATNAGGSGKGSDQTFTAASAHVYKNGTMGAEGKPVRTIAWGSLKLTNAAIGEVECHTVSAGYLENPAGGSSALGRVQGLVPYECVSPSCAALGGTAIEVSPEKLPWSAEASEVEGGGFRIKNGNRVNAAAAVYMRVNCVGKFNGQFVGESAPKSLNNGLSIGAAPAEEEFDQPTSGELEGEASGGLKLSGKLKVEGYAAEELIEVKNP